MVEEKWHNIVHYILTGPRYIQFKPGTSEYLDRVVDIQDIQKHIQLWKDLTDYIYGGNDDNE